MVVGNELRQLEQYGKLMSGNVQNVKKYLRERILRTMATKKSKGTKKRKKEKHLLDQEVKRAAQYLSQNKHRVGLADYIIKIIPKPEKAEREIAEVESDYYSKELTIYLNKDYFERDDKDETLLHELIHARVNIMTQKFSAMVKDIQYELEEDMVNDLTRGML